MKKNSKFLPLALLTLLATLIACLLPSPRAKAYISGSPGVLSVNAVLASTPTTVVTTTTNYYVLSSDRLIELYCTNQNVNFNSPNYIDGPAVANGNTITIKNMTPFCTNTVVASKIDGANSYALTNQYATITIRYDGGTNWCVLAKVATP
jgi:hypothetical protein